MEAVGNSPLGKVELSSVVASNSDDIEPTITASGASWSTTSIFVTSPVNGCPKVLSRLVNRRDVAIKY